VLLRHGAFCDERGRYLCPLARQNAAAFEEALSFEMAAAAQASSAGYHTAAAPGASVAGRLGPATSLGIAGGGFPTLDPSRGASSVRESAVLDAAADAAAAAMQGGSAAFLNLRPFQNLAPTTGAPLPLLWHPCLRVVPSTSWPVVRPCLTHHATAAAYCTALQCAQPLLATECTTHFCPSACATCAWLTGTAAAWASSLAKTWTTQLAPAGGGRLVCLLWASAAAVAIGGCMTLHLSACPHKPPSCLFACLPACL
jgi:hypothetical protein